ncbi:TIGR02217 family protein [Wolbachia endosymbiont of Drosophila tsacasi]|uniref:TIGR02217 family protein n=1 Tax=Wolbachia endosymbiont of Drosophila tsacasi TaxID=3002579 RepID=UPI0023A9E1B5|nr:TIGR02217 family protein [Wolbachia endosymbiont of Drosophila tsacasi]MDE5062512.1 TIGR02217 family protein [Wolbachia endosymbiont of Drosophila tsacasi]
MSFTEIRFPKNISYGSTGGPEFSTDVVTTHNGCEQRNINWSRARARYNIAYGVRSSEQLTELITFFHARKGKAIGFRFKDWSDFTVINQEIGIGDSKKMTFQLIKTYISGKDKHTRMIKKPVYDTIKIYLDDEETKKYSVNYSTGEITFIKPPAKGTTITASFEFDVPVRFDTDYLNASIDNYGSNSWSNIPLVEVK